FDQTYALRDRLEERFDIDITGVMPELTLKEQEQKYGEDLWKSHPNRCCYFRKVRPLRNYQSDQKAWITGIRRNQTEARRQARKIEWDPLNRASSKSHTRLGREGRKIKDKQGSCDPGFGSSLELGFELIKRASLLGIANAPFRVIAIGVFSAPFPCLVGAEFLLWPFGGCCHSKTTLGASASVGVGLVGLIALNQLRVVAGQ